jgi:glycosyltransferase involved in cell wall biosynthesis
MACEKPIVASPVGGVIDVVKDCENGRIAPVNNVNSLTTIILEILSDKSAQKHLGKSARLTVQSKFTLEQELEGNLKLYGKLGLRV